MPRLRSINRFLSWSVGLLAVYILVAPLSPIITSSVSSWLDSTNGYRYQSVLAVSQQQKVKTLPTPPVGENVLVIPKIGVSTPILEGNSAAILNQGIWRRPRSGTPETGGNTVLTGHRYLYTDGPNTFYFLDRLGVGDRFLIFWQGQEYDYEVEDVRVVPPERVEIERNTKEDIVTLYTCTPLWTSKNRLVVRAHPIQLRVAK